MHHDFIPDHGHISLDELLRGLHHHQPAIRFMQTDLISDGAVPAANTDPNLVNPWGVGFSPTGPFWISGNGAGVTTIYNGTGASVPVAGHPAITIPAPPGQSDPATPTGQVFNSTTGFAVSEGGVTAPAAFIFATEDGTISGWSPTVNSGNAILKVDNSGNDAVYKGLALLATNGAPTLYAANFHAGTVDMFDQSFTQTGSFTDPFLPANYAPFNVQALDGKLFVTFAQQDDTGHDDVAGAHHGFVDEFSPDGHLLNRIASGGPLDSPWGLAIAPASFGKLAGDLLVGNFGDGTINAFGLSNDRFMGKLLGGDGKPVTIDGLWALTPGNGGTAGDPNTLFFTAGLNDEKDGLFGSLTPQTSLIHGMASGY
jgi:uncharacterized protein (TIGR03118 family)